MRAPANPEFGQFEHGAGLNGQMPAPKQEAAPEPSEIDKLQAALAQRDETIQNLSRPPAAPAPAPVAAAPLAPIPVLGDQPDPTTHPDDFKAWMQRSRDIERLTTERTIAATRDGAVRAVRADAITAEFMAAHPEFASLSPQVKAELGNQVAAMGLSELPVDATDLIARSAKGLEVTAKLMAETQPKPKAPENRTEGLPGGSTSGVSNVPAEDEGEPLVGMMEAIHRQQDAGGFF